MSSSSSSDSEEEIEEETPKPTMKQCARDIDAFFDAPVKVPGSARPKRQCLLCKYVNLTITSVDITSFYKFYKEKKV